MLSLIATALIAQSTPVTPTPPDRVIEMGRTIPHNRLCHTLQVATGGAITNYSPCATQLGDRVCLLNVTRQTDRKARCWNLNKPAEFPRLRVAEFVPDPTTPPTITQGTGTRLTLGFVPLAQVNPIVTVWNWLHRPNPKAKPKAKPKPQKTWADYQQCVNEALQKQIDNGATKLDNAAARKACGG